MLQSHVRRLVQQAATHSSQSCRVWRPTLTAAAFPSTTSSSSSTSSLSRPISQQVTHRLFSATASAKPDANSTSTPKSDSSSSSSSSSDPKQPPPGDGEAGAQFHGEGVNEGAAESSSPFVRFLKRHGLKIAIGSGLVYAIMQGYPTWVLNFIIEKQFLSNLRTKGPDAIPDPTSFWYTFLQPEAISQTAAVQNLLVSEPDVLQRLIQEGLNIEGSQYVFGADSKDVNLDEMARASWILRFLLSAASSENKQALTALRFAHQASVENQQRFLAAWEKNEEDFRERVYEMHLTKRQNIRDPQALATKLAEFRKLDEPHQRNLIRDEIPMTLVGLLIQHGFHHKPKSTAREYEEEFKQKYTEVKLAENLAKMSEADRAAMESLKQQPKLTKEQEDELQKILLLKGGLFQRLIDDQVEKAIPIHAWSLIRSLAEPSMVSNDGLGLVLGPKYANNIQSVQIEIQHRTEQVEKLKKELRAHPADEDLKMQYFEAKHILDELKIVLDIRATLLKRLTHIFLLTAPSSPNDKESVWGPDNGQVALEVVGSLIFDIRPDALGETFPKLQQPIQQALFQTLATLAHVYAEAQYPGGAVHAAELTLKCDPHNHQLLTTLANEKLKLGVALQRHEMMEKLKEKGDHASHAFTADPRTNPFLDAALSHYKKHLEHEPKHLEANFNYLKTLVAIGESNESVLNKAADQLLAAVRASPTTAATQMIPILPGANVDSLPPVTETLPLLSPSYNLLIRTLERLNRLDEASELATEWSYRTHADALSHFTLGRLALREGELELAESELRTAQDLDPSKPETLYQLALVRYKAGDLAGSEEYINQALITRSKVQQKVRERVNNQLLTEFTERMTKQRKELEAAGMPVKPDDAAISFTPAPYAVVNTIPNIHLLRGKVLAKKGDRASALDALQELAKEKPFSTEGLILRAKLLQEQQQTLDSYDAFAHLIRVWRTSIATPINTVKFDAKDAKYHPITKTQTRKDYFDHHSKDKQVFEQLCKICTKPADKKAAEQWTKNFEEIAPFKALCTELEALKKIK